MKQKTLGTRMKEYEAVTDTHLIKNMPVINHDQEKLCDCIMYCGMCGTMDIFSDKFGSILKFRIPI